MAKEKPESEEMVEESAVSTNPEEAAWLEGMEGKYPDLKGNREALFKASREGYDREHKLNQDNADAVSKINGAIEKSPEVASFLSRVVEPEEGAEPEEAFAEFGEDLVDLLTGKIDSPTYREKKQAKAQEAADKQAAEDEKNAAIGEAFVEACKEAGLDPEETEKKIIAKFNGEDATEFMANKDFFAAIIKSLTYDDDMLAAEARGRNAKMSERNNRRSMNSDGLPRSAGNGAPVKRFDPNSLAAMAEQRRRANN